MVCHGCFQILHFNWNCHSDTKHPDWTFGSWPTHAANWNETTPQMLKFRVQIYDILKQSTQAAFTNSLGFTSRPSICLHHKTKVHSITCYTNHSFTTWQDMNKHTVFVFEHLWKCVNPSNPKVYTDHHPAWRSRSARHRGAGPAYKETSPRSNACSTGSSDCWTH